MHDSFVKQAREGKIELLFIGDSITEYWLTDGKDVWNREFAPLKAGNFGIAGDTTYGVLWRIGAGGELTGLNPKAVVLMIGTNDLSSGLDSPEKIAANVGLVVNTIKEKLPTTKIILLGIFPRGHLACDPVRQTVKAVNDNLAKLENGKDIVFIDIGKAFLDADGNLPGDVMPDGLHLSSKGYQIWANAIRKQVSEVIK